MDTPTLPVLIELRGLDSSVNDDIWPLLATCFLRTLSWTWISRYLFVDLSPECTSSLALVREQPYSGILSPQVIGGHINKFKLRIAFYDFLPEAYTRLKVTLDAPDSWIFAGGILHRTPAKTPVIADGIAHAYTAQFEGSRRHAVEIQRRSRFYHHSFQNFRLG